MRVSKVVVSYGRTFNLGDFNSVQLRTSLEAELAAEESPADVVPSLQAYAREAVKAEFMRLNGAKQ